ncbi:hypothetical protein L6164_001051 [Bauhinia variegata]|uniref:Uncharacterized protein n=1 Tax=Bauhinia variegata TaxID=167791 RepID=A0ACB9QER8_BAUVA|nr:hypothetical protein L6164_001051 [Bauhinia variegata]
MTCAVFGLLGAEFTISLVEIILRSFNLSPSVEILSSHLLEISHWRQRRLIGGGRGVSLLFSVDFFFPNAADLLNTKIELEKGAGQYRWWGLTADSSLPSSLAFISECARIIQ